jgi:hypothetical protein
MHVKLGQHRMFSFEMQGKDGLLFFGNSSFSHQLLRLEQSEIASSFKDLKNSYVALFSAMNLREFNLRR